MSFRFVASVLLVVFLATGCAGKQVLHTYPPGSIEKFGSQAQWQRYDLAPGDGGYTLTDVASKKVVEKVRIDEGMPETEELSLGKLVSKSKITRRDQAVLTRSDRMIELKGTVGETSGLQIYTETDQPTVYIGSAGRGSGKLVQNKEDRAAGTVFGSALELRRTERLDAASYQSKGATVQYPESFTWQVSERGGVIGHLVSGRVPAKVLGLEGYGERSYALFVLRDGDADNRDRLVAIALALAMIDDLREQLEQPKTKK